MNNVVSNVVPIRIASILVKVVGEDDFKPGLLESEIETAGAGKQTNHFVLLLHQPDTSVKGVANLDDSRRRSCSLSFVVHSQTTMTRQPIRRNRRRLRLSLARFPSSLGIQYVR